MGKPKGKRPLRRPRSRREANIKMHIREENGMVLCGFIWLRIGPVEDSYEHDNELLICIKGWEVLE
jgi:hypothetical protein